MRLYLAAIVIACGLSAWLGHSYVLNRIPVAAMERAESGFATRAGGTNKMLHPPLPGDQSRSVVRPSPDQFYSICSYDLSEGPVLISGNADMDTYWSLSFFQHNTDVFHVVNDRQLENKAFRYLLATKGQADSAAGGTEVIISPTDTGLVLQRVFVDRADRQDELDRLRKQARCAPAS